MPLPTTNGQTPEPTNILGRTGGTFSSRMGNTDVSGAGSVQQANKQMLDNIISKLQNITNVNATIKSGAYEAFGNNFLTRGAMGLMDSVTGLFDSADDEPPKKSDIQLVVDAVNQQKKYLEDIKDAILTLPSSAAKDKSDDSLCSCQEQLDKILLAVEKPIDFNMDKTNEILKNVSETLNKVVDELELIDIDIRDLKGFPKTDSESPIPEKQNKSKRDIVNFTDVVDKSFFDQNQRDINKTLGGVIGRPLNDIVGSISEKQEEAQSLTTNFPALGFSNSEKNIPKTLDKILETDQELLKLAQRAADATPLSTQESVLERTPTHINQDKKNKKHIISQMIEKVAGNSITSWVVGAVASLVAWFVPFKKIFAAIPATFSKMFGGAAIAAEEVAIKGAATVGAEGAASISANAISAASKTSLTKRLAGPLVSGAITAYDIGQNEDSYKKDQITEKEKNKENGGSLGGAAGAWAGAEILGTAGLAFGPVGAILGALIGGLGGGTLGYLGGGALGGLFGEDKKHSQIQIEKSVDDNQAKIESLQKQVEDLKQKKEKSSDIPVSSTTIINKTDNSSLVAINRQPTKNTEASFNRYLGTVFAA